MRKTFLTSFFLLVSTAVQAQPDEAWVALFNGEDFSGWEKLNGDAEYTIEGDAIVGTAEMGTPNTFLATREEYGDFILEYEIRVDDRLNSGVQIRSNSDPDYRNGRVHGYQVEIDPSDRAWSGGIYDEARRGWLYHLDYNPEAKNAFRNEQWNTYRVEAVGDNIRVWLNGVQTVDLVDDETEKGFIALQVHSISDQSAEGAQVKFRNIRIITDDLDEHARQADPSVKQVSYLDNQLTEHEERQGWELLWDGRTTNGWTGAHISGFPEQGWSVEDGVLIVNDSQGSEEAAGGGDIVTTDTYGNFILEVDFRLTRGANSGIKYFVDPGLNRGQGSAIGCEFQILDDEFHPDAREGVNGNRTLASLYDLIPADARYHNADLNSTKPVNEYEWNRATIVSKDNRVTHYLNGIKVVEYERNTQMWRSLVDYSKYEQWESFCGSEQGNILLQDHGDEVHFKNIKINVQ